MKVDKILENSIKICGEEGYIIYSTCSLNQIENEAVIASILEKFKGEIETVNCSEKLFKFGVKFKEGMVNWRVPIYFDPSNSRFYFEELYSDFHKNIAKTIDKHSQKQFKCSYNFLSDKKCVSKILPSMFHQTYTYSNNHQNSKCFFSDPLNLRNCVRFYAHENDSLSGFIAVLKKKKIVERETKLEETNDNNKENTKMKTIGEDLDEFIEFLGLEEVNLQLKSQRNNVADIPFFEEELELILSL